MKTNNRIREEIEEEFIEILECGKNLKGEEVWTDLEKMQWLRKKIDELLKSQREEMIEKIEKMAGINIENNDGTITCLILKEKVLSLIKEQ